MNYLELDTPALIIDRDVMMRNIRDMQGEINLIWDHILPAL